MPSLCKKNYTEIYLNSVGSFVIAKMPSSDFQALKVGEQVIFLHSFPWGITPAKPKFLSIPKKPITLASNAVQQMSTMYFVFPSGFKQPAQQGDRAAATPRDDRAERGTAWVTSDNATRSPHQRHLCSIFLKWNPSTKPALLKYISSCFPSPHGNMQRQFRGGKLLETVP